MKFPFSSKRKRMSLILKKPNGEMRLLVKGASEFILQSCEEFIGRLINYMLIVLRIRWESLKSDT